MILDLVGSRDYPDRAQAQRAFDEALRRVAARVPGPQPLRATLGDEGQGMFATLADALVATLLIRLAVPDPVDVRCGVGAGEYRDVSDAGGIQDGSAWWSAREAIETAKTMERGRVPEQRSWYVATGRPADEVALVNAYLLARDHLIGTMREADRRRLLLAVEGRTQTEIARMEGISESAVSQSLRRSGGRALALGMTGLHPG